MPKPPLPTVQIGNLEMLAHDLEQMPFGIATITTAMLGEGWRLPTLEETQVFQSLSELGVGGFRSGSHWTQLRNRSNPSLRAVWYPDNPHYPEHTAYADDQSSDVWTRPVRTITR